MSTNNPPSGEPDRVDEAIAWYYQQTEAGSRPSRQSFLDRYPSIRPELESFLADKAAFEHVADSDSTVGLVSTVPPVLGTVRYFGDYELLEEIARGGMGIVYKARQVSLNRVVALKMILTGRLASPADVQRFQQEAEAAASLDHPNILPIYEVGEHNGQQYFSMKLVEGGSLSQLGPIDQRNAAELIATLARAVHYAHQRGILHRDLKPANILMGRENTGNVPYITDFGLAKKVEGDLALTQSGALVGTPSYMSPEQARAEKQLSTGVDIYSLGAMLFELLAGRPPFRGETVMDTILQVMDKEAPDPRTFSPKANRDLAVIALKCLSKEPAKRYESAAALADDLDRWQRGEPIIARPVGPRERFVKWIRRHPVPSAFTALTLVLLIAGIASITSMYLRSERFRLDAESERDGARDRLSRQYAEKASGLSDGGNPLGALPWLVEAARVSEGRPQAELHRIHLASILRTAPGLVHYSPTGTCIHLHPDGERVAIGEKDGVRIFRLGEDEPLTPVMPLRGTPNQVLISGEGRRVLVSGGIGGQGLGPWQPTTARLFDVDTGKPLTDETSIGREKDGATLVRFAGNGSYVVAIWQGHVNRHVVNTEIYVYDAATLKPAGNPFIWGHPEGFDYVKIDFQNLRAITTTRNVNPNETDFKPETQTWDVKTGKPLFEPIVNREGQSTGEMSPDGKHYIVGIGSKELRIHDTLTGKAISPIMQHENAVTAANFHPKAQQIVTVENDKHIRVWDWPKGERTSRDATLNYGEKYSNAEFDWTGDLILATGASGLRAFDAESNQSLFNLEITRSGPVYETSPDGVHFLVSDYEGVRIYRRDGKLAFPFLPNGGAVFTQFSGDGRFLATHGNGIRVWDLAAARPNAAPLLPERIVPTHHAEVSSDGEQVVDLDTENHVQVFDSRTGRAVSPRHRLPGDWEEAKLTPDRKAIITIGYAAGRNNHPTADELRGRMCGMRGGGYVWQMARDIAVWDAQSGQPIAPAMAHRTVSSLQVHPNARELYVIANYSDYRNAKNFNDADEFSELHRWDLTNGEPLSPVVRHKGKQTLVDISRDGSRLLALVSHGKTKNGSDAIYAQLWQSDTLEPTGGLIGPADGRIAQAKFSPDDQRLLTVSEDGEVEVWNVATGERVLGPLSHVSKRIGVKPSIRMADFSPDGRKIVTATGTDFGDKAEARIWDAATGKPLTPNLLHSYSLESATFSPDGRLLATLVMGDDRWQVCLWDTETGMRVSKRSSVSVEIQGIANERSRGQFGRPRFTPDGRRLLLPSNHGMIAMDVLNDSRSLEELTALAQVLSGHEIDEAGSYVPLSEANASQARERWKKAFPPNRVDRSAEISRLRRQSLATAAMTDKNWHAAIRWLTECMKDDPNAAWPLAYRAAAHEELIEMEESLKDLDEAIRRKDGIELRKRRADLQGWFSRFRAAAADYAWVLERSGQAEDAIMLAISQWAAGDRDGHRKTCEILRERRMELGKSWDNLNYAILAIGLRPDSEDLLKSFAPIVADARTIAETNSDIVRAEAVLNLRLNQPEKNVELLKNYRDDPQGFYSRHRLPELIADSKRPTPPADLAARLNAVDDWYAREGNSLHWKERALFSALRGEVKEPKK